METKEFGFHSVTNGELLKMFKHKIKIVRVTCQQDWACLGWYDKMEREEWKYGG